MLRPANPENTGRAIEPAKELPLPRETGESRTFLIASCGGM